MHRSRRSTGVNNTGVVMAELHLPASPDPFPCQTLWHIRTGVINNINGGSRWTSSRVLALCTLAPRGRFPGTLNGTEPLLMLVVPPVLFLPLLDQNVCCKKDPGIVHAGSLPCCHASLGALLEPLLMFVGRSVLFLCYDESKCFLWVTVRFGERPFTVST